MTQVSYYSIFTLFYEKIRFPVEGREKMEDAAIF